MDAFMWECVCGHIEYSRKTPDECSTCFKIGEFTQLPEEIIEERKVDLTEKALIFQKTKRNRINKINKSKLKKK